MPTVQVSRTSTKSRDALWEVIRLGVNYEYVPKGGVVGKAASPALTKAFTKAFGNFLDEWDAAA